MTDAAAQRHPIVLTIVTPVRNGRTHIERAIASVESQFPPSSARHGPPIEHILVDGASTDGTAAILRAYADRRPDLVTDAISEADRGQSDAINKGMRLARGLFATWLNADDWYEPNALQAMVAALGDTRADGVVGRARFVDASGQVVFAPSPPDPISIASLLSLTSQWYNGRLLVQPEVFFRTDLFHRVGGLDIENAYSMDHDLWVRMLETGAKFEKIDVLVASQGVHAGQKTANKRESVRCIHDSARRALERVRERLTPDEAAAIEHELDRIRRKLAIADGVAARWSSTSPHAPTLSPTSPSALVARGPSASALAAAPVVGAAVAPPAVADRSARRAWREARWKWWTCHKREVAVLDDRSLRLARRFFPFAEFSRLQPDTLANEGRTFEVVAAANTLAASTAPQAMLESLWRLVGPGGWLILTHEPAPASAEAIHALMMKGQHRLDQALATNRDTMLGPAADERLAAFAIAQASPHPPILDAATWLQAQSAECVRSEAAGPASSHPLLAFLGDDSEAGAWTAMLWRKPGQADAGSACARSKAR